MNNQLIHKIEERLLPLMERIEQLEQGSIVQGIDAIERHCANRDDIGHQIDALEILATEAGEAFSRKVKKRLQSLALRLEFIPQVPRIEVVRFAQNVLAQKPLVLITDDIINEETEDPELTRIFLMEPTEVPRVDYSLALSRQRMRILEQKTTPEESTGSGPVTALSVAWSELQRAMCGRYLIAFNLPLVQVQLAVTARMHGLPVPMLIGHSLLDLLVLYVGIKEPVSYGFDGPNVSLTDAELCDLMEREEVVPFYDRLLVPTEQRALHLLHTLQKMADGTLPL